MKLAKNKKAFLYNVLFHQIVVMQFPNLLIFVKI